jgi:hypothetical protein
VDWTNAPYIEPQAETQTDDEDAHIPGVDVANAPPQDIPQIDTPKVEIPAEERAGTIITQAYSTPKHLVQTLRRSTHNRSQPRAYTPSMSGSRHSYSATQLQNEGVLDPDAHMFMRNDFYQAEPDVVAAVITQLSLKGGLKEWGETASAAAEAEMKQLHF